MAPASSSAAPSRSTTTTSSPSSSRSRTRPPATSRSSPTRASSARARRMVHNFFVLQEGPYGVLGDNNLIEMSYGDLKKDRQRDQTSTGGWLGFTDKYWATVVLPEPGTAINAPLLLLRHGRPRRLPGELRRDRHRSSSPPGRRPSDKSYVFAGAKVEVDHRQLQAGLRLRPARPADRLGLVPLHHLADVPPDPVPLRHPRQLRARDPRGHGHRQGGVLPARQPLLRLDGGDAAGAAGDEVDPGALQGRSRLPSSRR